LLLNLYAGIPLWLPIICLTGFSFFILNTCRIQYNSYAFQVQGQ
jgi:hypothetical protein